MAGRRDPKLQIYLKLADEYEGKADKEFLRNVSNIGHWGTGDLEVNLRSIAELEKAKALIALSYERS